MTTQDAPTGPVLGEQVGGPGQVGPLPPMPDSVYPPDATPLEPPGTPGVAELVAAARTEQRRECADELREWAGVIDMGNVYDDEWPADFTDGLRTVAAEWSPTGQDDRHG